MADGIGGPCTRCGVEHEIFEIHNAIGTPVLITDGPYAGQVGLAIEVSRYGGPWHYRVIIGAIEACSQELRESFDPCQLRELMPGRRPGPAAPAASAAPETLQTLSDLRKRHAREIADSLDALARPIQQRIEALALADRRDVMGRIREALCSECWKVKTGAERGHPGYCSTCTADTR